MHRQQQHPPLASASAKPKPVAAPFRARNRTADAPLLAQATNNARACAAAFLPDRIVRAAQKRSSAASVLPAPGSRGYEALCLSALGDVAQRTV